MYGRSPAWNLLCVTKCRFSGNERPHSWHTNGRSRVCTRRWVSKWCFKVKHFLHSPHWYGRSVVCKSKWVLRQCLWEKSLPQWGQTWGRSPGINQDVSLESLSNIAEVATQNYLYVIEHELSSDALTRTFCHIARKHTDALCYCRDRFSATCERLALHLRWSRNAASHQ